MDPNALIASGAMGPSGAKSGAMAPKGREGHALIYKRGPLAPTDPKPTIIIDSREQTPLNFTRLPSIRGTLQSGDYSVAGLEHIFAIERKSLDDLAMSCTTERERFERELHRLRGFHFKRLVVIGTREEIEAHTYRSRATPKAILASLQAFEVRYDLPLVFATDATQAATLIESWAYWFAREQLKRVEALQ